MKNADLCARRASEHCFVASGCGVRVLPARCPIPFVHFLRRWRDRVTRASPSTRSQSVRRRRRGAISQRGSGSSYFTDTERACPSSFRPAATRELSHSQSVSQSVSRAPAILIESPPQTQLLSRKCCNADDDSGGQSDRVQTANERTNDRNLTKCGVVVVCNESLSLSLSLSLTLSLPLGLMRFEIWPNSVVLVGSQRRRSCPSAFPTAGDKLLLLPP